MFSSRLSKNKKMNPSKRCGSAVVLNSECGIILECQFITVRQNRVARIPLKNMKKGSVKPYQFSPFCEFYDQDSIKQRALDACANMKKETYTDDAEFVERMCVNPMSHGAMIVVEHWGLTRCGIVVQSKGGNFEVIWKRRANRSLSKWSFSKFTQNATKITMWQPPSDKLKKLCGEGYTLLPRTDVAERAEVAYDQRTLIKSPIGKLKRFSLPERFLLQISIFALDWRLMETKVLYSNVLVKIYQPSKELKLGDIVFAGRPALLGTYYHAGVVYSVSDDGDVFIGHFGPDKNSKKKYKACIGCPKLTTFDEFMRQNNGETAKGIYRVEYLRDGSTHDVFKIQERIAKSVRGELLPTVKDLEPAEEEITEELSKICKIVELPDKTRKVPCYHLKNWNCEDWAFWIVRGEEKSSEGGALCTNSSTAENAEQLLARDAENEGGNQGEKVSSAQGTQGTNIAVNVGQVFDKPLFLVSVALGVTEDFLPAVARALGKDIPPGCGKVFDALGRIVGRATIGVAAFAVSAAAEGLSYGVNHFTITKKAKKGKITEAEKELLINVLNQDAKFAAAQIGVTSAGIPIALIPVAGPFLAGIYAIIVGIIGQRMRNEKKREAIMGAIWESTANSLLPTYSLFVSAYFTLHLAQKSVHTCAHELFK